MRPISIAIPSYNRYEMTVESFAKVLDVEEVTEVVIIDDCSTDGSYEKLVEHFKNEPKVKIYRNETNLDCYRNKREAIEKCTGDWVILLDSDNVIDFGYLYSLFQILDWRKDTAYMPSFAAPTFSYQQFEGLLVTKGNVAKWMDEPMFTTMLNCMNYFVNRNEYLRVWDGSVNPHTADSIFQNYNWLNGDNKIHIVSGLKYQHRIHGQSHYILNNHKTGDFYNEVEQKIRQLL